MLEESLKTTRLVHRLLLLIFGTSVLFWIPQPRVPDTVFDELKALSLMDSKEYLGFAQLAAQRAIRNSPFKSEILKDLRSQSEMNDEQLALVEKGIEKMLIELSDPPFFTADVPDNEATVADLYRFFQRNPPAMMILPSQRRAIEGYLYASQHMINHGPWESAEITLLQDDRSKRRFEISITGQGWAGDTDDIDHVPARDIPTGSSFLDWVRSDKNLRCLVGADSEDGTISIFPATLAYQWNTVSSLTPSKALTKLELDRAQQEERSEVKVFGLPIRPSTSVIVIPVLGLFMSAYLLALVLHLESFPESESDTLRGFPWLGTLNTWLATGMSHVSLIVLPILTFGGLIWHSWNSVGVGVLTASLLLLGTVVTTCCCCSWRIWRLQQRIGLARTAKDGLSA